MGGSLARALAGRAEGPVVVGWSPDPEERKAVREAGLLDELPDDAEEVARLATLVVYAVPLGPAVEMLRTHRDHWREDAVVTDVVSLKLPMITAARDPGPPDRFVGGHPMAGSEARGFGASRADLYRGARVWVTTDTGSAAARGAVFDLWKAVGARPEPIGAEEHDRRMVWASHLPQVVSNALAHVLEEAGIPAEDLGPGGLDMTRLAASAPEIWIDLLDASGPRAARALDTLGGALNGLARDLRLGRTAEIRELMEQTRRWRRGESS